MNRILDDVLVNQCDLCRLKHKRRCQKVAAKLLFGRGQKTTTAPPLSAALMKMSLRFFRLFSADHSSEERLENLVLRLNLSLLISWRLFLMKKSKDANWPSGGVHLDFRTWRVSKISSFEMLESSSLSWKKAFNWTRGRYFSTSCLT